MLKMESPWFATMIHPELIGFTVWNITTSEHLSREHSFCGTTCR